MSKIILLILLINTFLFAGNSTHNENKASKAYNEKNFKIAHKLYSQLSKEDNAFAQFELAGMYHDGIGTQKNIKKAISLYEKSAKNGNTLAKVELGILYVSGKNIKQDYKKAFKYFKDASKTGNDEANYYLGRMYWNGYGVNKDYTKAVKYYKVAVKQGHASAQYSLGSMLKIGQGSTKDLKQAYSLFEKSANNIPWSAYSLAIAYLEGNAFIKKDESKGMLYLSQAVEMKDLVATSYLAKIYHYGLYHQKKDSLKAMQYYEIAVTKYEHIHYNNSDAWQESLARIKRLNKNIMYASLK